MIMIMMMICNNNNKHLLVYPVTQLFCRIFFFHFLFGSTDFQKKFQDYNFNQFDLKYPVFYLTFWLVSLNDYDDRVKRKLISFLLSRKSFFYIVFF